MIYAADAVAGDATQELTARLREATRKGQPLRLPAGVFPTRGLDLPDGARIIGAGARCVLRLIGPGPLLSCAGGRRVTLEALALDGADQFIAPETGLVDFRDVGEVSIHGCTIRRAATRGINLQRCGGPVAQNAIEICGEAAFVSTDGRSLDIDGNHIRRCGDNGVKVWTTVAGRYEGSRIRNNTIEDIAARSGGAGQNGNGVSIWGSGGVTVENNRISRCAYTAVRNNAGHSVAVRGNTCRGFGEKAMYAEFGAKASTFRGNHIEDAGGGIAVANADKGTDGATIAGNTIMNLRESHPDREFGPAMLWRTGVLAEKNAEIIGNTIVGPAWIGVALGGWRENLRAEGNTIIGADYGVVFATGEGVGAGVIARNKISGARKAAIAATAGPAFLPGDVAQPGAAAKYPRLTVEGNSVE
jgi:uncharacterized secreted repeat protein (TIGR03808 family)